MVGLSVASSSSPSALSQSDTAEAWGKTAAIFTHRRLQSSPIRQEFRSACAAEVRAAFPGPSRRACCLLAAQMTGASPDTIERMLEGETQSPDAVLVAIIARFYTIATGKPSAAMHLLQQIAGAA